MDQPPAANLILRVTARCLLEDLRFAVEDLDRPIEELAGRSPLIRAFVDQRSQLPIGQETIQGLTSRIVAYALHSGEDRGATWHQERAGVVWLLAAAFHRSGKRTDAYPYFRQLDREGRLLPTREDAVRLANSLTPTIARSLLQEVPVLRDQARRQPGVIQHGLIGGRIAVRLVYEAGETPLLTVAISQRLRPGVVDVPADWLIRVAAAFLPDTPADKLSVAWDLAGEELDPTEVAFCDFLPT